ncbi:MAG: type II secretion system protein [Candidatus Neomarinimicrobiota bacterium]
MQQKIFREKGFTLIELIIVIAVIGTLGALAVPTFFNLVDDAHQANMDAVEGVLRSAVTIWASDNLLTNGVYAYPPAATVTIANITEDGAIVDWSDNGAGTWTYAPTGGTLVYTQIGGGTGYTIGDDDDGKKKKKKKKKKK